MSKNIEELENAPLGPLLLRYSLPSIAGITANALYHVVDSIFIGRGVGPLALSGMGVTFPVMTLIFAIGTLVGLGGAAISSIRLGRKDYRGTEHTLGNVLILSILGAVILALPVLYFLDPILIAFGASEQTLPYAHEFMVITLLGLPFTYLFFNLNHVMRATGYPQKAMFTMLLTVVINAGLASMFIFWVDWGFSGVATATVLAQMIGVARVIRHFRKKKSTIHFRSGIWSLHKDIVTGILSIGMAPCLVNACSCIVTVAINKQLLLHGGDLAIGAYGVINRVLMLFAMVVIGITQGMQPIVGYNFGALKPARVIQTLKYGFWAGSICTTLGFVCCMFFPELISLMFTDDARLIDIAASGLRRCTLIFPLVGGQIIIGNFFQSLGKPRLAILLSVTRQMLFLLPFLLFLPSYLGVNGVWFSLPIADFASCVLTYICLYRFMRYYKLKNRHYMANA